MKKYVLCLFLLIISQICNGQTRLLNDSEVITNIETYRKLRYKYYFCDTALATRDSLIAVRDQEKIILDKGLKNCENALDSKDKTIADFSKVFDNAIQQIKPPKTFSWTYTIAGFGVGVGVGAIVTAIIIERGKD